MEPHITKIVQIARQISYYRKFLTPSAAKTLIHAYITSKLDYCNGLLHGLSTNCVAKLQSILNTADRMFKKTEIWAFNTSYDQSTLATNPVQDSI